MCHMSHPNVFLTFCRCQPRDTPSSSCPRRILYNSPTSSTLIYKYNELKWHGSLENHFRRWRKRSYPLCIKGTDFLFFVLIYYICYYIKSSKQTLVSYKQVRKSLESLVCRCLQESRSIRPSNHFNRNHFLCWRLYLKSQSESYSPKGEIFWNTAYWVIWFIFFCMERIHTSTSFVDPLK